MLQRSLPLPEYQPGKPRFSSKRRVMNLAAKCGEGQTDSRNYPGAGRIQPAEAKEAKWREFDMVSTGAGENA
ncbi:MAG: hypothetical protein ABS69_04005 [Nitrosomonadales bacterium SCN 54-20]|nr:MAG: hypothetical protein ABS69_04005 [Nitrosomonadales bacterium SCN 54-20]